MEIISRKSIKQESHLCIIQILRRWYIVPISSSKALEKDEAVQHLKIITVRALTSHQHRLGTAHLKETLQICTAKIVLFVMLVQEINRLQNLRLSRKVQREGDQSLSRFPLFV